MDAPERVAFEMEPDGRGGTRGVLRWRSDQRRFLWLTVRPRGPLSHLEHLTYPADRLLIVLEPGEDLAVSTETPPSARTTLTMSVDGAVEIK